MQALLKRMNEKQLAEAAAAKSISRSASVASSFDDNNDDDRQSISDESQTQEKSMTLKWVQLSFHGFELSSSQALEELPETKKSL